jgi:CspA family cold shock protein
MRARVKWFDNRRGWGFLVLEDGREVFVHHSDLAGSGYRALRAGQEVDCDLAAGERPHATGVRTRDA